MRRQRTTAPRRAFVPGLLVFVAGGCLMIVEIIGGRAIAPYFGSNVYVWGSVLGVFMGALSVGYALGGRVADASPRPWLLPALALGAACLVALVPTLGAPVCEWLLRTQPGPALRPLLPLAAAMGLYFLPSVLLGMIVPVAVRAAARSAASVGRVVGRVYALNALGSVAGALLCTFVLAAHVGNRAILRSCGVALLVVAAVCLAARRRAREMPPPAPPAASDPEARPVRGLRPLVFLCGMVFMSLEVVGGAVLAPYYGSNVFVWGTVITLFLCALSVGYRVGGRLADRAPSAGLLAGIVAAAGLAILLIPLLAPGVCSAFASPLKGWQLQPLFASILLYAVPTVLLAMVAPFAVRLAAARVERVGGVAGGLYALSTLGNVAGALLTTFVLISAVGKIRLLEGAGLVVVLGAAGLAIRHAPRGARRGRIGLAVVGAGAAAALALCPKPLLVPLTLGGERAVGPVKVEGVTWQLIDVDGLSHELRRFRAEHESPYHHIAVIDRAAVDSRLLGPEVLQGNELVLADGRAVALRDSCLLDSRRDLRFDRYAESAVLLDGPAREIGRPYTSGVEYSDLLHLPFLFRPDAQDALMIGGGGGVVPMIFRRAYPGLSVDVVEIDPVVVDVAREWFGLKEDERLRTHIQDGRMFIHNSRREYDVIILDVYTAGGRIPFHLTTREFLAEVRGRLRPDGVVLMNVITAVRGPASRLFRSEYKTFVAVFGREHVYVFPKRPAEGGGAEATQNVMLIATGRAHRRRLVPSEVELRARRLVASGRIAMPTLPEYASYMLTDRELWALPQDDVPLLTDDYAPVDLMAVERD